MLRDSSNNRLPCNKTPAGIAKRIT
jgi:hypothetical protein